MTETLNEAATYPGPLAKFKPEDARSHVDPKQSIEQLTNDANNNYHDHIDAASNVAAKTSRAVHFKYRSNACRRDLEEIRRMLVVQRTGQVLDEDEWQFFKSDFNRMMIDDWLVTRFLLRGKKANYLQGPLDSQTTQVSSSDQSDEAIYARTIELIGICAKFRYQYKVNALTKECHFPLEWTSVNGMFNYGHDRVGNPVAYLRAALHRPKLIEGDELRQKFYSYMLYVLEQCDQDLFQRPGKAICCVFDMSNVAFENIDLDLTTWMIKSFKNCAPKLLCYVIIYNPPWFFTATFKLICSTLLSNNKRQSIKFVHREELLDFIDHDQLPSYLRERIGDGKK